VSALSASPADTARIAAAISPWPNNSVSYFAEVQDRVKRFVGSGQLGIFANGYWGHPAYKLPPAVNLLAVAHYLEALDWQRDVIRLHTIFGGKNPHPNFLVGGMASAINLDSTATINAERLTDIRDMITRAKRFVEQVYWPDLAAVAGFYKEWAGIGGGVGNYMSYGEFPENDVRDLDSLYFPRGIILNKDLSRVLPFDHEKVAEYIQHSWYEYQGDQNAGLHPWQGQTNAKYVGPEPPWEFLQDQERYTWMKAPRYDGKAMEVGPLARMLVAYGKGHEEVRNQVGELLGKLGVGPAALFSTLGRTGARAIETVLLARKLEQWYEALVTRIRAGDTETFNREKWDPSTWPANAQGFGYLDAPRGGLGHWVVIENGQIRNYQCVVPSTWNASPRGGPDNAAGPYEAALMDNHPLVDPNRPIEILRTIHSFDPCIACGVHVLDAEGNTVTEVKVQ
jgi:[NiFe] hydrogenase large subunit/hydrogenase large subunit